MSQYSLDRSFSKEVNLVGDWRVIPLEDVNFMKWVSSIRISKLSVGERWQLYKAWIDYHNETMFIEKAEYAIKNRKTMEVFGIPEYSSRRDENGHLIKIPIVENKLYHAKTIWLPKYRRDLEELIQYYK